MFVLFLGIIASILAGLHFLIQYNKARKLPPGPMGLPVFGYYFFLRKNPMLKLHELSKTYGNVFGLYLGSQYFLVVDDWPVAKETLNKTAILDRFGARFAQLPYKLGLVGTNGHEWVQNHRVTSKAIKEISINKVESDDLLQEEILDWVQFIIQEDGKPLDVNEFFGQRLVSNLMARILGEGQNIEHSSMKKFTEAASTILGRLSTFGQVSLSPSLRKLLAIRDPHSKTESVMELAKYVSDIIDSKIDDPVKAVEKESFIGRFQEEIDNQRKDATSFITVDSLKGNAFGLMAAGGDTLRTSLIWALIAMAENPDKQQKVHEELDSIIGKDGILKWGEQCKVPYTYASQLETLRWRTPIPFITRRSNEDLEVNGYHVPKGTNFIFNTWAMHNDSKFWTNTDQFIPERFLLEDGRTVNLAHESFNPFSFGRRHCIGKQFALKTTFLIFTILMQNFKVVPKSGEKVEYETSLGLSYCATNVKLRFIQRKNRIMY